MQPKTNDETKRHGPRLEKRYCTDCGKPLGNSADGRCYDCGGRTYRGGSRITGEQWKILLGVSVHSRGD